MSGCGYKGKCERGGLPMNKLIKQLYEVAGSEAHRIKKMLIFDALVGLFEGLSFGAVLFALLRVSAFLFTKRPVITEDIVYVAVIGAGSLVGKILCGYGASYHKNNLSYKMGAENRLIIGDRLKKVNMGFFTSQRLGDVSSGLTTVIGELETVGIFIIEMMVAGFIQTALMVLFIFPFDMVTGIIIAGTLLLAECVNMLFQNVADSKTTQLLSHKIDLYSNMVEFIKGIGVIKAFGKSKSALSEIETTIDKNRKGFLAVEKTLTPATILFILVLKLGTCAIIASALLRYGAGTLPPDKTIVLIVLSCMVFGAFELAGSMQNMKGIAVQNLKTIIELRNISVLSEGTKKSVEKADIAFCDASFSYRSCTHSDEIARGEEVPIDANGSHAPNLLFNKINCTIPEGKTTAIVGPSGSGKTTLCNLMTRFWDVSKGAVLVGGTDVKDYSYDDLLSAFSMVFQNVYLFDDTVLNNIKFGKPDATLEEVMEAAKAAQCHDFISSLPNGYDTVLHEGGSNLSGGEKQRISIARALLKPSMFVILDEATSSIDPENEEKLLKALNELLKNKTVVVIAHKMGTVKGADQIIVLDNGTIESSGTHTELAQRSAIYRHFIQERKEAESWQV